MYSSNSQMSSPYMAPRYGIWGENPYGAPTALGVGMSTSQGLGNIAETQARTGLANSQMQDQNLKNAFTQQTQPGLINYTNADDAAKAQYALPNAQADYQKVIDANKETLSHANYFNAAAGATDFSKNPVGAYNDAYRQYQLAQDNTPQKMYLAGILNKMIATNAGGFMPAGSQNVGGSSTDSTGNSGTPGSTGTSTGSAAGGGGYIMNPLTQGKGTNKGSQYYIQNPDGTVTSMESPTTATQSQVGKRIMAHGEVIGLGDPVTSGLYPYVGNLSGLIADKARAIAPWSTSLLGSGNQPATDINGNPVLDANKQPLVSTPQDRLNNYTYAQNNKAGLAAAIGRFDMGGEPTEGYIKQVESGALGNHFFDFTPQSAAQSALARYLPTQSAAFNQSINPERTGFQIQINGKPMWVGTPSSNSMMFTGNSAMDAKNVAAMSAAKATASSTNNSNQTPQMYYGHSIADINAAAAKAGIKPEQIIDYLAQQQGGKK